MIGVLGSPGLTPGDDRVLGMNVRRVDTSPSIAWRSVIPRFRTGSRIACGDREAAALRAVLDPALNSEK